MDCVQVDCFRKYGLVTTRTKHRFTFEPLNRLLAVLNFFYKTVVFETKFKNCKREQIEHLNNILRRNSYSMNSLFLELHI